MSKSIRTPRRPSQIIARLVEPLEDRRLMSVTTLVGTAGDDVFTLPKLAAGDEVIYDGKGGHDTLHIVASNGTKTGNGYGDGSSVAGIIRVLNANGGTWDVEVAAMSQAIDHTLVTAGGVLTGAVKGTLDYSKGNLRMLNVEVGTRTRGTAILREAAASAVNEFHLFGDWDADVGDASGTLAAFHGALQLSAEYGQGVSTISLNDGGDLAAHTVTLDGHQLTGLNAQPITIGGFDQKNITLGSGDKTINVKGSDARTTVISMGGKDAINVGNKGSLGGIHGGLKFLQYTGTAALTVDGSADAFDRSWTIDANHINPSGLGVGMTFYGNDTVKVLAGSGKDTVLVNATNAHDFTLKTGAGDDVVTLVAAAGKVSVDAGAGDYDSVAIGTNAGVLSKFAQGVAVIGAENVSLSNAGDAVGRYYVVTPTGLKVDGVQRFSFANATALAIAGGNGNDIMDAYGAASYVGLYGNGGNDQLSGSRVEGNLYGGDGDDAIVAYGDHELVDGGAGNDRIDVANISGSATVHGGAGHDTLRYETVVTQDGCENVIQTARLTGNVFRDLDQNGVKNAGEPGQAGRQVWIDANKDGSFDYGDLAAFTDAAGNYLIRDVTPGNLSVNVLPANDEYATTNDGKPTLASFFGGWTTAANFGVHAKI